MKEVFLSFIFYLRGIFYNSKALISFFMLLL
jgi:hypothetical protein